MKIRLTQIDGKLPNLALMRLSAWHKARGDAVHFTRFVHRDLFEPFYDRVYASSIFTFSAARIRRLQAEYPGAIIGGTGTNTSVAVESIIGEWSALDYSPYPSFTASIGFTQRGCRLKCKFCVVPTKEGKVRSVASIAELWRGKPWPRHLHLLDNDFFGQDQWRERIAEIKGGGFKVCFNQGINVRLVTDEVAEALAGLEYRDDQFRRRRLYTAWDNLKDEKVFSRGVDTLGRHGIPPKHLMAYMLIGFDPAETWARIFHRFERMVERGILPYPMVYDRGRRDLLDFQRWVVTGLYRAVPWSEYAPNAKRMARERIEVPAGMVVGVSADAR